MSVLIFKSSHLSCSIAQGPPTDEPRWSSSQPLGHSVADLTMADVDLTAPLENPYHLDLHGLSKAAARVALHVVCSILHFRYSLRIPPSNARIAHGVGVIAQSKKPGPALHVSLAETDFQGQIHEEAI